MTVLADIGDVLGSPVWTVLATVFAAVAIFVSVWLTRRNQVRKSMSGEINVTELVSLHKAAGDAKGRIKIYFDDEEIEQVHLVEVKIENTGNVPVLSEDFEEPLMVELGEDAHPLTAEVTETKPADLNVKAVAYKTGAVIAPLLLNPGDAITLKIFARNLKNEARISHRVVGISEIEDTSSQRSEKARELTLSQFFSGGAPERVAALGVVTGVMALLSAFGVFGNDTKTETTLHLLNGKEICGDILRTGEKQIVMQRVETGEVVSVRLSQVQRIDDNSC